MPLSERIKQVILNTIPVPGGTFDGELRRDDTEQWDSLAHLRLITALETELGCSFSMADIQKMDSFSAIVSIAQAIATPSGCDD